MSDTFNGTDPLDIAGLKEVLQLAPIPLPWIWLVVTLLVRYIMTEYALDKREAGIIGLIVSTISTENFSTNTDQEWSVVLRAANAQDTMINISTEVQVSKRSIERHSWQWFEYLVDCLSFKKHLAFQSQNTNEIGQPNEHVAPRHRSPYMILPSESVQWRKVARPSCMPREEETFELPNLSNVSSTSTNNESESKEKLKLAYGTYDVEIPGSGERNHDFYQDRAKMAISTIICFGLFGWGAIYYSMGMGIALIVIPSIITIVSWSFCCRLPSQGQPHDFCQRIKEDSERIHQVAESFRTGTGRNTIDVILYLDSQARWTWCRIGDSWMSIIIPTERPIAESAMNSLSLIAHTLLPTGWINETNITSNVVLALAYLFFEYVSPFWGSLWGILAVVSIRILGIQPLKTGDWWILSYYAFLFGRFSGGYNLAPLVNWLYTTCQTLYEKILS